jgi:hypothetical protein
VTVDDAQLVLTRDGATTADLAAAAEKLEKLPTEIESAIVLESTTKLKEFDAELTRQEQRSHREPTLTRLRGIRKLHSDASNALQARQLDKAVALLEEDPRHTCRCSSTS